MRLSSGCIFLFSSFLMIIATKEEDFLRKIGLSEISERFLLEDLSFDLMLRLGEEQLQELGLNMGQIIRLVDGKKGKKSPKFV